MGVNELVCVEPVAGRVGAWASRAERYTKVEVWALLGTHATGTC